MKNCSFSRELIEQETLRETEFSPLLFVASSKRLEKVKGKQEKAGVHRTTSKQRCNWTICN